jgi:FkbM family methyltransferase
MAIIQYLIESAAKRMGYTLYASWRNERRVQAQYLAKLFKAGAIDAVLDVGANRGQYRDFLRSEVGYQGLIFSFEPVPDLAGFLESRASSDPAWFIFPYALGRNNGTLPINVTSRKEFSSFLLPKRDHQNALFKHLVPVIETVAVEIRTLSEVFPELKNRNVFSNVYLKLDTQGFDLEVLAGGEKMLGDVVALQTEAAVQKIYEEMTGYQESIDWLQARGFVLSAIHPVENGHFPELVEFDCHMVRAGLVNRLRLRAQDLSA